MEKEVKAFDRTLSIRSLIFPINDDYVKFVDLARICRKEEKYLTCHNILNRLKTKLKNESLDMKIEVELNIQKCLYWNNQEDIAISNLKVIIDSQIDELKDSLKSKIYCYYSIWNCSKMGILYL